MFHNLPSLFRTMILLAAQGWRNHDDADALLDARLQPGNIGTAEGTLDVILDVVEWA